MGDIEARPLTRGKGDYRVLVSEGQELSMAVGTTTTASHLFHRENLPVVEGRRLPALISLLKVQTIPVAKNSTPIGIAADHDLLLFRTRPTAYIPVHRRRAERRQQLA